MGSLVKERFCEVDCEEGWTLLGDLVLGVCGCFFVDVWGAKMLASCFLGCFESADDDGGGLAVEGADGLVSS